MPSLFKKTLILLSLVLVLSIGTYYWLKQPYPFTHQKQMAQNFIQLILDNKLEAAYQMTMRTRFTGMNFEAFKKQIDKEIATSSIYSVAYSWPEQTNGNRLRRYLRGVEVELPKVTIEFEGGSLLRVVLCYKTDGQWSICRFDSHAG